MKRHWTSIAAVAYSFALPALALANEGGEHAAEHGGHGGWDTTAIAASVVNFIILIALFVKLFSKAVKEGLKKRRAEVETALMEAAKLKAEAEAKHKEYTERLAKLDSELAQIKSDMIAAGQKERDRIVADAEHKAARMRKEAEFLIEQQAKQLSADLTREAVEGAIGAAEALLVKATTAFDQTRLAQEYLSNIDKSKASSPSVAPKSTQAEGRA